jgi:ribonuclease J
LITEGTRINEDGSVSEKDVYLRMREFLKKDQNLAEKLIFLSFPWKSISRFLTVYQTAKELNRVLVIQPKLAYTIYHLQKIKSLRLNGILKEDLIKIYLPRKDGMIYSHDDYTRTKYHLSPFSEWSNDKPIRFYSNLYESDIFVKAFEIKSNPNKYIVHLNFYQLNELIDIQPPEGSYFFNLKTEPFDEEGELEEKVLLNWLSKYGIEYKKDYYHASGHASGAQIREMIDTINPKQIFPIHTEHPEAFNYENAINEIRYGKKYQI